MINIRLTMGSGSMTDPPVLPWYAIAVIIIAIIIVLIIWYYMYPEPPTSKRNELKIYYNKPGPKSFDFFNTLVTRRDTNVPIYETKRDVETYHPTNEDFEKEKSNLIPICSNLRLLKPGDYVVSDTCYTSVQVAEMLQNHIDFPVDQLHVIATKNGKARGDVWTKLPKNIVFHYGDNYQTDVESPQRSGIKSFHYDYDSDRFNEVERIFLNQGLQKVAIVMREMRLSNPISRFIESDLVVDMWEMQTEYNILILVLFILFLRRWLSYTSRRVRKVYCILRDCWYLKPLLEKYLHIDIELEYLYCSRKSLVDTCVNQNHQPTIDYFRRHAGSDTVWVDVSGSGNSMIEFTNRFRVDPYQVNIVRLDTLSRTSGALSSKADQMVVSKSVPTRLELINSAPFGSFIRWESNKPVLSDFEYPIELVNSGSDSIVYHTNHGNVDKLLDVLTDVHIGNDAVR